MECGGETVQLHAINAQRDHVRQPLNSEIGNLDCAYVECIILVIDPTGELLPVGDMSWRYIPYWRSYQDGADLCYLSRKGLIWTPGDNRKKMTHPPWQKTQLTSSVAATCSNYFSQISVFLLTLHRYQSHLQRFLFPEEICLLIRPVAVFFPKTQVKVPKHFGQNNAHFRVCKASHSICQPAMSLWW